MKQSTAKICNIYRIKPVLLVSRKPNKKFIFFCNSLSVECVPGSSSDTGLRPCSPCEKNTYQPKSRQRNCIPCPYPNITFSEGAVSLEYCIGKLNPFVSICNL